MSPESQRQQVTIGLWTWSSGMVGLWSVHYLSSVIMSHGSPTIWQVEARDIAVPCPPNQLSSCKRSVLLRAKSRAGGPGQPRVLGCMSEFLICVA